MNLNEKFGQAVVRLRKERGVSQEQFAFDSGIDRRYMSDIENGKRNVSLDIVERIAQCFHITLAQLFEEVEKGE